MNGESEKILKLSWSNPPGIKENLGNPSIRIRGVPAEIRTEHLPNEVYCITDIPTP
jgi:hypothetical protein